MVALKTRHCAQGLLAPPTPDPSFLADVLALAVSLHVADDAAACRFSLLLCRRDVRREVALSKPLHVQRTSWPPFLLGTAIP